MTQLNGKDFQKICLSFYRENWALIVFPLLFYVIVGSSFVASIFLLMILFDYFGAYLNIIIFVSAFFALFFLTFIKNFLQSALVASVFFKLENKKYYFGQGLLLAIQRLPQLVALTVYQYNLKAIAISLKSFWLRINYLPSLYYFAYPFILNDGLYPKEALEKSYELTNRNKNKMAFLKETPLKMSYWQLVIIILIVVLLRNQRPFIDHSLLINFTMIVSMFLVYFTPSIIFNLVFAMIVNQFYANDVLNKSFLNDWHSFSPSINQITYDNTITNNNIPLEVSRAKSESTKSILFLGLLAIFFATCFALNPKPSVLYKLITLTMLISLLLLILLSALQNSKPLYILSTAGIKFNKFFTTSLLIKWDDITFVKIVNHPYIIDMKLTLIFVKNPSYYLAQVNSRRRFNLEKNQKQFGTPFILSLSRTTLTQEAFINIISNYGIKCDQD